MIEIIDDVIYIHRGDSATIHVNIRKSDGTDYELQEGDELKLSVRQTPAHESPVLLESTHVSNDLYLSAEAMDAIPAGKYSYDVQLKTSTGEVITVLPKLRLNGKATNYKNFIVDAEVTD